VSVLTQFPGRLCRQNNGKFWYWLRSHGGAVVWPLAAYTQQANVPVVGLLNGVSNRAYANRIAAVREGLLQQGFVEGRNVKGAR
jgi:hypothetical protein